MHPPPHYRTPVPQQPTAASSSTPVSSVSRFHELLDALRQEYEQAVSPNGDNELKLQSLFNEFVMIQKMVRELEGNYLKMKRRIEEPSGDVSAPNVEAEIQPTFTNILNNNINNSSNNSEIKKISPLNENWNFVQNSGELTVTPSANFKLESVVCGATFSADGKQLGLALNRCCVVVNLESYKQAVYSDFFEAESNVDLYMRTVSFSPDGKLLAGAGEDHHVRIWSVESGKVQQRLLGHLQDVYSVKFSKDGKKLFSASGDRTVRMWDTRTWECVRTFSAPAASTSESGFTGLALSSSGKYLATVISNSQSF